VGAAEHRIERLLNQFDGGIQHIFHAWMRTTQENYQTLGSVNCNSYFVFKDIRVEYSVLENFEPFIYRFIIMNSGEPGENKNTGKISSRRS